MYQTRILPVLFIKVFFKNIKEPRPAGKSLRSTLYIYLVYFNHVVQKT